jgi:hypothetical protein
MGLRQLIARWTVRGIARTQFRIFRLTQQKNPGVPETTIAPLVFTRRMQRFVSPVGQNARIEAYLDANGPIRTLRDACYAIAVVEFKIDPLDDSNVSYLVAIVDQELARLGYAEEDQH